MQLVFSDAQYWADFLPLSFTRPIAQMRCGMLSFSERWTKLLEINPEQTPITYITEDYLSTKYPAPAPEESLFLVPNFLPTPQVIDQIKSLQKGQALVYKDEVIASRINLDNFSLRDIEKCIDIEEELLFFSKPSDLFSYNKEAIAFDFELLTKGKTSQDLCPSNNVIGDKSLVFLEEGAQVQYATLNTKEGPIYLGKNAEIMEGSMVRGSLCLLENAKINMGAKIYSATTIGPFCKVGGEVNNVIFFGYSNKGHDGFLGNSVIGQWCNLGADTNSSNLKNNYAEVKLWSYKEKTFKKTGLQFCGVIMGDHSKTAINTQLNTGTVVGVAANIFTSGFPPNKIDSFSWGGASKSPKYVLEKAYEACEKMMQRRKQTLSQADKEILEAIYLDKVVV